jgi:hypothetical protein
MRPLAAATARSELIGPTRPLFVQTRGTTPLRAPASIATAVNLAAMAASSERSLGGGSGSGGGPSSSGVAASRAAGSTGLVPRRINFAVHASTSVRGATSHPRRLERLREAPASVETAAEQLLAQHVLMSREVSTAADWEAAAADYNAKARQEMLLLAQRSGSSSLAVAAHEVVRCTNAAFLQDFVHRTMQAAAAATGLPARATVAHPAALDGGDYAEAALEGGATDQRLPQTVQLQFQQAQQEGREQARSEAVARYKRKRPVALPPPPLPQRTRQGQGQGVVKLCRTCWNPISACGGQAAHKQWPRHCGSTTQQVSCGVCSTPMAEHRAPCPEPTEEVKQQLRQQGGQAGAHRHDEAPPTAAASPAK